MYCENSWLSLVMVVSFGKSIVCSLSFQRQRDLNYDDDNNNNNNNNNCSANMLCTKVCVTALKVLEIVFHNFCIFPFAA
jgi:hypothetical protein